MNLNLPSAILDIEPKSQPLTRGVSRQSARRWRQSIVIDKQLDNGQSREEWKAGGTNRSSHFHPVDGRRACRGTAAVAAFNG